MVGACGESAGGGAGDDILEKGTLLGSVFPVKTVEVGPLNMR